MCVHLRICICVYIFRLDIRTLQMNEKNNTIYCIISVVFFFFYSLTHGMSIELNQTHLRTNTFTKFSIASVHLLLHKHTEQHTHSVIISKISSLFCCFPVLFFPFFFVYFFFVSYSRSLNRSKTLVVHCILSKFIPKNSLNDLQTDTTHNLLFLLFS